jgi:glycosyltransferase involved in cell wall biosynthesis
MNAPRLTVVMVHNRYLERGGEDAVVEAETTLLERNGWTVIPVTADSRLPDGPVDGARLALSAIWSLRWYRQVGAVLARDRADLLHLHNSWPVLSPSVVYAAGRAQVPVVMTLHNYRLVCPAATLMRAGAPCEECLGRTVPWPAVLHRCYRASRAASGAATATATWHRLAGTWTRRIDRFIALTEFAKGVFVRGGLPAERIAVKPNFVFDSGSPPGPDAARRGALFVGRLSGEKGIDILLGAWARLDVALTVIGRGDMLEAAGWAAHDAVTVAGPKSPREVANAMEQAAYLVMPSIWYESFPVTVLEAFSRGLPVIASRLGALAEIVEDGITGLLARPADAGDLAAKVRWAEAHPVEMRRMGANARSVYEQRYRPEQNFEALWAIYEQARAAAAARVER